mgnify:CR=1 FL=1
MDAYLVIWKHFWKRTKRVDSMTLVLTFFLTENKVQNLIGMEMKDLYKDYIFQDIPVILWATIEMEKWKDNIK